jgi:MFS family permease
VSKGLYGVFLAVGAAGNLPGALLADRIANRIGNIPTVIVSALVSGAAYLVMATAKGWPIAGTAFFVVSFAVCAGSVVAISLRQRLSPRDLMGRIGSAWRGIVWGAAPIGSLIGGEVADKWGVHLPLFIAGIAQCVVAVVLAGPLAHSFAASEKAVAGADDERARTGSVDGEQPWAESGSAAQVLSQALEIDASQIDALRPKGRRLHSRPGHGPLYWGRSSRNSRR